MSFYEAGDPLSNRSVILCWLPGRPPRSALHNGYIAISSGISFLYSRLSPSPFRFGLLFRLRVHDSHFFPRLASRKGDTTVFCIGKETVQIDFANKAT